MVKQTKTTSVYAKDRTEQKQQSGSGQNRKVWRFIDYQNRWGGEFEKLPKYLKWYINCWDGSEGPVLSGISTLRAQKNFIWLQGALVELLTRATNVEPEYQGYILTSRMEPATATEIGRMLRVDGRGSHKTVLAALQRLSEAGFLESVDMPEKFKDKPADKPAKKTRHARNVTTSKSEKKPSKKQRNQAKNVDSPFKGKGENLSYKKKEIKKESRRRYLLEQIQKIKGQGQPQVVATTAEAAKGGLAPTTTPPMSSTSSDVLGQARDISGRMPAPASIGNIVKIAGHRYDSQANEFADEVLTRCGYFIENFLNRVKTGQDEFSDEQFCERAHWAKAWTKAREEFDSTVLEDLRAKIYKRADKIGRSRHTKLNPEAYLMRAWNNLVLDVRRKCNSQCKAM